MKKIFLFIFVLMGVQLYSQQDYILTKGGRMLVSDEAGKTPVWDGNKWVSDSIGGGIYGGSGTTPNETVVVSMPNSVEFDCENTDGFTNKFVYNASANPVNGDVYYDIPAYTTQVLSAVGFPINNNGWRSDLIINTSGEEASYNMYGTMGEPDEKWFRQFHFSSSGIYFSNRYDNQTTPAQNRSSTIDFQEIGPYLYTGTPDTYVGLQYEEPYANILNNPTSIPCLSQIQQIISDSISNLNITFPLLAPKGGVQYSFSTSPLSGMKRTYQNLDILSEGVLKIATIPINEYDGGTGYLPNSVAPIIVQGGDAPIGSNVPGGAIQIISGNSETNGGSLELISGSGERGGDFTLRSGSGTGTENGAGGGFLLTAGQGGEGGNFTMLAGDASREAALAGSYFMTGGSAYGIDGIGGILQLRGGNAPFGSGGSIQIEGGSGVTGGGVFIFGGNSSDLEGGPILLTPGSSSSKINKVKISKLMSITPITDDDKNKITSEIGDTIYCSDCTATDGSTGVMQTYNGTTWKNHW